MRIRRPLGILASIAAALLASISDVRNVANAAEPGGAPSCDALTVEPVEVLLQPANRRQQVLVTAHDAEGRSWDATRDATMTIADPAVARFDGTALVALADGATELIIEFCGREARVPVRALDVAGHPPVHFGNDVMPIFTKLGCNSGGCHGRAAGQNGFKLSVFGYDPLADYDALVKEARGRRVFPASPIQSLILLKPTSRLPHGGGRRLAPDSLDFQTIESWIQQGMPLGSSDAATVVGLQVSPSSRIVVREEGRGERGEGQQILATAVYSDGTTRDVTSAALYATNAPLVADVDRAGLISTGQVPGEAAITVNYMGQVAAVSIQVPRGKLPQGYTPPPANNPIDDLVWAKLEAMGIAPSDAADDATFLRRLYLDSIGTLPQPQEVREFLADLRPDKRARWIDAVLDRPEYASFWGLKWADILLVDRQKLGERGAFELHRWLVAQFAANRPYDEWVRELVAASGNSARIGPVNFYRAVDTPDALARVVSQALLGVRIECAQCHHHPFEKWSQDDFYGLAGFFNGVERKSLGPDRVLVYHAGYRETRVPISNRLVPTRALDGPVPTDLAAGDPRVRLAEWITAPENPWFARLAANRLWKHYLGRGLVEPEDDLRSTNPATNLPLLAWLSQSLIESDYDLKALSRLILNSRVYQRSSTANDTNRDDEQNFSHYMVKRLPAEVLLDAICQATGDGEHFSGRPPGTRSIELWDNRLPSYFLEIFGRPERNSPCECGRSSEPTMSQALHLMNAPEIESKLADPEGRVAALIELGADDSRIIEELCLATVGRPPSETERQVAADLFATGDRRQAAEDFLWTLLNSYDFLFNH